MAASKGDLPPEDDGDWYVRGGRPSKREVNPFAFGGSVLVTLLAMGIFLVWQAEQAERRQMEAQWERDMAVHREMEAHYEAEQQRLAEVERAKLETLVWSGGKAGPEEFRKMFSLEQPPQQDPAKKLFGLALKRWDDQDLDGAVEALRQAAALDPQYADEFEKALKQQALRDHTAPPPREVTRP